MKSFKKNILFCLTALCTVAFLLTGCMSKDPVQTLHESLEKIVELEKPFRKAQKSLKTLEQAEGKLYKKMIKLNMDEFGQMIKLSNQALKQAEKRQGHLNLEKESIEKAKKEFETAQSLVGKIDDQKIKRKAKKLISQMEKRYQAYDQFYKNYQKAIDLDKQLYKLMQNKQLKLQDLEEQLKSINEKYKDVLKQNVAFNDYTTKYNKVRKDFYKNCGFDITEKST
ncbi:YkyA family protein [Bacillus sp. CLL-7-23]|uniref:YkyA family protein n=1 Tax=Bacillus changyiensis TaxID=3004103 RepID=A0ABT4X1Y8_9BACI|nr:YkyA family protein [Bacillus changyiensis]MDA7026308.1 YkyA family protein [Bacillus changyiensis]